MMDPLRNVTASRAYFLRKFFLRREHFNPFYEFFEFHDVFPFVISVSTSRIPHPAPIAVSLQRLRPLTGLGKSLPPQGHDVQSNFYLPALRPPRPRPPPLGFASPLLPTRGVPPQLPFLSDIASSFFPYCPSPIQTPAATPAA